MAKQSGYYVKAKLFVPADTKDPMSMGLAADIIRELPHAFADNRIRILGFEAQFMMHKDIPDPEPEPAKNEAIPEGTIVGDGLEIPPLLRRAKKA